MPSVPTRPRVSIGMPVFNGAQLLRPALDSLLGQTFSDFELIISDNASTDESPAIVEEYALRDGRVRFVRQEHNRGAAWNFNHVVELAQGDYFKWAAADDVCAPTFIERCVEVLDGDSGVVCCHSRTRKIDEHGETLDHLDDPTDGGLPSEWFLNPDQLARHRPDASSPRPSRRFADILLHSGWAARSYSVFRMEALRRTSLLLPYYGSEKTTMVELALQGRFYDVPETLFFQRVHDGASSRLQTSKGQQQYITGTTSGRQSPRFQLVRDYLRALGASKLSLDERFRCYGWIASYVFQFRKWPQVISAALRGRGIGGNGAKAAVASPGTATAAFQK